MKAPPRRARAAAARARGGPLVMLALLIGGWCSARVVWWEHPFASAAVIDRPAAPAPAHLLPSALSLPPLPPLPLPDTPDATAAAIPARAAIRGHRLAGRRPSAYAPLAYAPSAPAHMARLEALLGVAPSDGPPARAAPVPAPDDARGPLAPAAATPPFLPLPAARPGGRWSLDAWALWRQGSGAAPVSQGRVPVYGASQTGAVLQYRLAPASGHDPRLYARAYRALVNRGESEAALGASLRPLARVPVRLMGELRYTDAAVFAAFRPAALAVTEIAPLRLPFGVQLEAYGQAGWVGGRGATPFADGQAIITRPVPLAGRLTGDRLGLSLGAGAWGGAQEDAQRLDIGPTLRVDTRIGHVPARLAIDWRLRVAGDASPGSGVAATVSTGF